MNKDFTISYQNLRRVIGFLGIFFPFFMLIGLIILGGNVDTMPGSISAFYYTGMRNMFVSLLTASAISFFFYRSQEIFFNNLLNLAGVCALGVAFFPTTDGSESSSNSLSQIIGYVHLCFAGSLFLIQGIFCLFLFPKSANGFIMTTQKKIRNKVYRYSGSLIFLSLIMMAIYLFLLENKFPLLKSYHPIFIFETIGLQAAGLAWFIKGELIFKDIQR